MKQNVKRTLAGMTAVLCMAGCLPAVTASAGAEIPTEDGIVVITDAVEESQANDDDVETVKIEIVSDTDKDDEPVEGGWEIVTGDTSPEANPDAVKALDKIMRNIDGVACTPVAVLARQCVAGTNYCLLCKVAPVVPEPIATYQLIYVYEDLQGSAMITGRQTLLEGSGEPGSFEANNGSTALEDNEAAQAALYKSLVGLGGMAFEPIAYLGSQAVAGTNYMLLCRTKGVYPGAEPDGFTLVIVYEDLSGNARLNGMQNIKLGESSSVAPRINHVNAHEPTCTKPGCIEFWGDQGTGKLYKDEAMTEEITIAETIIPALGHDFDEPEWDWCECDDDHEYDALLTVNCKRCHLKNGVKAKITKKITEPTAEKAGSITYTATAEYEGKVYTDTKTVVIPKLTSSLPVISYEKGDNAVKLTWTAVEGAEKYAVCGLSGSTWKILAQGSNTSYVLNGLKAGTEYKVAVIAKINGRWNTDYSNAVTVTPKEAKASAYPVVKSQVSGSKFRLQWTAVRGATKYGLAVKQSGKWVAKAQFDAGVTTYTSPSMKKGDYTLLIAAKVNGKWELKDADRRAVKISIS